MENKKRKLPKRGKSLEAKKDTGKRNREATRELLKLEKEEVKLGEHVAMIAKSERVPSAFSELNREQDSDTVRVTIHNLNTRLADEKQKAKQEREMFLQMIKQLQDEKEEIILRYEGKLSQLQEDHKVEKDKLNEDLRRQEDLFKATLSEMKSQYQERIVFLQTLLAPSAATEIEAVRSRYFVQFQRFHSRFENEVINQQLLYDLDDQLQECEEIELRAIKVFASHQQFWEFYAKYRIPQFAAYACRVVVFGNVSKQRNDHVLSSLDKYSQVYFKLGITRFDEAMVSLAYKQVVENPDVFAGLKQASSIEHTAKIIKTVGHSICGINGINFKVGRKSVPKPIVEFEDMAKSIMKVMREGYEMQGIDQYSAKLFGFFLGVCLVTGQRNKTVREVKFADFSQVKGKFYLDMFATKNQKATKYEIAEGIYKQVLVIQSSREWMKEEAKKTEGMLKNKEMDEGHAKILKDKLAALERRLEHVFPFFHSEAVHWHAARFRVYLIDTQVPNGEFFTIHTIRAIALTNVAYDPEAARALGSHKSVWTTTRHYVADPFKRNMIKGLDFSQIIQPTEDTYVDRLMRREKKDEEYRKNLAQGEEGDESEMSD